MHQQANLLPASRTRPSRSRLVPWTLAAAILAVAIWFRLSGALTKPLWLDEAYSAYAAGKDWAFLWQVVPRYETHPPLYYSLLRLWTLPFGDSLGALRMLGVLCSLATVPVVALAAREIGRGAGLDREKTGWLMLAASALTALSPILIVMAREVRPYPVLILVYSLAILALLRLGRRMNAGGTLRSRAYFAYLASLALVLWLHNLGPLFATGLGLGLLVLVVRPGLTPADWLWLLGGHFAAALIWLPGLLILLDQAPTWVSSTWLTFDWEAARGRLMLLYGSDGIAQLGAALALVGLAGTVLLRSREGGRIMAALLIVALVPVIASLIISVLVAPVFILRTMTPVAVPALLLFAAGATARHGRPRAIGLGAFAFLAASMATADIRAIGLPPQQDWYSTVRWLAPRFQPGDIVYAYPNEGALPFDYAVRDLKLDLPSRAIPTAVPSIGVGGWNPTGSRGVVSLPRERLRAIARSPEAQAVPTIWLLRLGPWAYDKGDVFLEELSRGRTRVDEWRSGPIDIIGLRKVSPGPAAPGAAAAGR